MLMTWRARTGFTLIEVVLGTLTLVIAITAILGAFLGQTVLNEHARHLSLAIQDANRVIEQIRQDTTGAACNLNVMPPSGANNWDAWLNGAGGGKSIQPTPSTNELIVVTCQNSQGTQYCPPSQVGAGEWKVGPAGGSMDPLRVTIAVCWRHRNRTIGECTVVDGTLMPADGQNGPNAINGVIESPAMLTTLVTCRR